MDVEPAFREVLHPSGLRVFVPIEHVAAAPDVIIPDAKTTCRYASKRCTNPRTTKRNGELHSFCEMHRAKANQNQRRLESKKKLQRDGIDDSSASIRSHRRLSRSASPDGPAALERPSSETASPRIDDTPVDDARHKVASSPFDASSCTADYINDPGAAQYAIDSAPPEQETWVASHYYSYHPQQQSTAMAATDLHASHGSVYPGFGATRLPYTQFPPPLNTQQLIEWELTGDLVGTSVAYAQTLNL